MTNREIVKALPLYVVVGVCCWLAYMLESIFFLSSLIVLIAGSLIMGGSLIRNWIRFRGQASSRRQQHASRVFNIER